MQWKKEVAKEKGLTSLEKTTLSSKDHMCLS